jgi:hypothetical protein
MGYTRLTLHHIEDGIHHLATIVNTDDITTRPAEDNHGSQTRRVGGARASGPATRRTRGS